MSWVLGLTGGIGSGKSAAADDFADLGACVVDSDVIAHRLTAPGGAAIPALRAAFGDAVVTAEGALDRDAMRARVFADAGERVRLESILHPLIRAASDAACQEARAPYVVLVVPLLIEKGDYRERCQRVCVVDCPEAMQIERVMRRNGMDRASVQRILDAQIDRQARLAAADDVIDNSGERAALRAQVEHMHRQYLRLAGQVR